MSFRPFLIALFLVGCGAPVTSTTPDSGLPFAEDAGLQPTADAGLPNPCDACPSNTVCMSGECRPLQAQCPCQGESYCDLTEKVCKAGCLQDSHCETGRICDPQTRRCRAGCRTDAACGAGNICEGLVCKPGCRTDEACGAGNICEGLVCRPGCRKDAQCGPGGICEALTCKTGCHTDAQCTNPGEICEASTQLCRVGCRNNTQCTAPQTCHPVAQICHAGCLYSEDCDVSKEYCHPTTNRCEPFAGSTRCTQDSHCALGYACNLKSLTCVRGAGNCSGGICYGSGTDSVCVNDSVTRRGVGADCSNGMWCGKDNTCSPVTLKCVPLGVGCGMQPGKCGASNLGLSCTTGGTCACSSCGTSTGYTFCNEIFSCTSDAQCAGLSCISGKCSARRGCKAAADCPSSAFTCTRGRCTPYYQTQCKTDPDCGSPELYCIPSLGLCGRR